ncbi:MAG: DUF368 domain-containing protein [Bacteroidota bacterium]
MDQNNRNISTALKGMAMGMAEVIPGVSGGTIAFITGIYERLINAIRSVGPQLINAFRKDGIAGAWKAIDGKFLLPLLIGMAAGIVLGVFAVSWLLESFPPVVWGFFFGLIIASAIYVGKQIEKWGMGEVIALIIGTAIAYGITVISPANGSDSLFFVFISGAIAISALILPGISGSFILLLMGMYTFIISDTLKPALKTLDPSKILTMAVFALGCLTGLATISRLLSWLFKEHRGLTLAALTGFMLGSLNKIWPWRNPIDWLRDASNNIVMDDDGVTPKKILVEANVWPSDYEGEAFVLVVIVFIVIGFASVFLMEKYAGKE